MIPVLKLFIRFMLITAIVLCLLVSQACTPSSVNNVSQVGCIGSFHAYAYTVPDKGHKLKEAVSPSAPWQVELSLPKSSNTDSRDDIATVRYLDGQLEIWIDRVSVDVSSNRLTNEFVIYRPDTKELAVVSGQVEDTDVYAERLYATSDGSIWGQNAWRFGAEFAGASLLSRFNEQARRFEFVRGIQEIPSALNPSDQVPLFSLVLLDTNDVFWILAHGDAIYSFDTNSQSVAQRAQISGTRVLFGSVSPNGSIFFETYPQIITFDLQEGQLLQFDPHTGLISTLKIPKDRWPAMQHILVDQSGRLWYDTVGWREPDGTWHTMYPDLDQYFRKVETDADYHWATPDVIMESSNRYIWYRAEKGMAWLDPVSMDGCWFTTENTSIVEDREHTIWMVAHEALYKYKLNP